MSKPLDVGTPERQQHVRPEDVLVEATEDAGQQRVVIQAQWHFDYYARRGWLAKDEGENRRLYDAGNEFRQDWTIAGLEPNVVAAYRDMVSAGSVQSFYGARLDAYKRWQDAVKKIGPIYSDLTIRVACFGQSAGRGRGMRNLRIGLDRLAREYGY